MEQKTAFSIFDSDLQAAQVTRSTQRRKAVIIPIKKGMEMAAKVQKEIEGQVKKEREEEQWRQA